MDPTTSSTHATARRVLTQESLAIGASVLVGGIVFGVAARDAGVGAMGAISMSLLPFSGAAQFAALGTLDDGGSLTTILVVTALLNLRHVLYGVSLAPSLAPLRARERAAMAHVLTDESFALGRAHFARVGHVDRAGYWIAALVAVYVPWNLGTALGALAGGAVPDLSRLGVDVVYPATMAALAVSAAAAADERRSAAWACVLAVGIGAVFGTAIGVVAGAALAPFLVAGARTAPTPQRAVEDAVR